MPDNDELGGTLPSLLTSKPVATHVPGEELPFEAAGRYAKLGPNGADQELGRGGLGRVILARDEHLHREVAVKEMLPGIAPRSGSEASAMADRFLREARITAQLEHPGVVPVYELGKRNDGSLYYAMKRVRGRTLADALKDCVSLEDRLSLMPHFVDVVQTIAFAHTRGIVHRDLKPENVMVGAFGETQVVDWGLARAAGQQDPPARPGAPVGVQTLGDRPRNVEPVDPLEQQYISTQTVAGQAMGTPAYMSPEQARGEVALMDAQGDVWSLGVMLFELLTGQVPFSGKTSAELLAAVVSQPIPPVKGHEHSAPPALISVVNRALDRDRGRRYATAVEMADALTQALGVHPTANRRSPTPWVLGGALLLALLAAVGLWRRAAALEEDGQRAVRQTEAGSAVQLAQAVAERAQSAWDDGDVNAAATLAAQALALADVPLARGVQSLAILSSPPRREWTATVPGGCVAVAARAGIVACATLGGVVLFDAQGSELGTLSTGPMGWQRAVVFLDDGTLASAGDDKRVHLWGVADRSRIKDFAPVGTDIGVLAASANGERIYAGLRDGTVLAWPREGTAPVVITTHPGRVRALEVSRTPGEQLVTSSGPDGVRVIVGDPPKSTNRIDRPASALLSLPQGALIVALERDLFLVTGTPDATRWSGHLDDVTSLAATRNWPIVSGSSDGTVRAWADGRPVARISGFDTAVSALAADLEWPSGPDLYVATRGKTLEGWRWPRDGRMPALPELGLEPTSAAMAPDGTVVVGFRDASVKRLIGARNAADVRGAAHQGQVRAVAVSEHVAISGGDDGQVLTWKDNGPARQLEKIEGARVRAVAVSRDGERAAWSLDDGTRVIWSLKYEKEIFRERDSLVNVLAFSPDGALLAAGRDDKQIGLYDATSGKLVRRLEGHDGQVHALLFSADGATLASGADDKRVTLWEVSSGRARNQLVGAKDRIGALAFSVDQQSIAAGTDDGAVLIWDLATLTLTREIRLHAGDVLALGFGTDGRLLVAGTDRTVRWLNVAK